MCVCLVLCVFSSVNKMRSYLLAIAKDYWGTIKAVDTAVNLVDFFVKNKLVDINDVHDSFQDDIPNVRHKLHDFVQLLQEPFTVGYIVMVGHGNQIPDANGDEQDGLDEVYQAPDGTISDDEMTQLANSIHDDSLLVLVSDHCSSGTMLDSSDSCTKSWVNIASSLPYEDSYTSGDGNVMTGCLLEVLKKHDLEQGITVDDLDKCLVEEMKNSFIGELQHSMVSVSRTMVRDMKIFRRNVGAD